MNRLALFDCDGTLVDSQHGICTSMARAFEAVKRSPPSRPEILAVVGLSLPQAVARLIPEADDAFHLHVSEHYKRAFQQLRGEGALAEPLFDGMADLLDRLERDGWMLGVATGKSDRGLDLCLGAHRIRERFVTLQTADRHPSKPHPSMVWTAMADAGAAPETTVMIGDTSFDIEMGLAAGAGAVGVGWGYHPPADLLAAGARGVAMDSDDLHRHIAAHVDA